MKNISLKNKYTDWIVVTVIIEIAAIALLMIFALGVAVSVDSTVFLVILFIVMMYGIYQIHKQTRKVKTNIKSKFYIRDRLLYFISSNKLYEEGFHEYEVTDKNGRKYIEKEKYIRTSACFSYELTNRILIIYAHKNADNFTAKMSQLEEGLRSLFNLNIEQILDRNTHVEYHMTIKVPERLNLKITDAPETVNNLNINLGYDVVYNPVNCPHILISGGTGSGKSVFISFLLLEFLKRKSTVYICDPKNSDLGSLSYYLGNERVATSPNNIARLVRLVLTEMNERYKYMNENFKYGSNFVDHGYKSTWLIMDELGGLQASATDKKSKEVLNEIMDGLKQIILLGRQSGVFVLVAAQQMNANTLNTDLRDNLGLRIALGANSSEGYRMVFGSATPETYPPIDVKGSGLLYMQSSGKESAQYYESPFVNMQDFDFITELKKYL